MDLEILRLWCSVHVKSNFSFAQRLRRIGIHDDDMLDIRHLVEDLPHLRGMLALGDYRRGLGIVKADDQ